MQSVSFTTTVRIREPENKIVNLDEYRREHAPITSEEPGVSEGVSSSSAQLGQPVGFRRKLQDFALLLEICVGFSLLVLTFTALFRLIA